MAHRGKLGARLLRIERLLPAGCPDCRHRRDLIWIHTACEEPDGTVVDSEGAPLSCGRCGSVPEQILEIVEVVVESREDLARLYAEPLADPGVRN
jgi:hypothetical protein